MASSANKYLWQHLSPEHGCKQHCTLTLHHNVHKYTVHSLKMSFSLWYFEWYFSSGQLSFIVVYLQPIDSVKKKIRGKKSIYVSQLIWIHYSMRHFWAISLIPKSNYILNGIFVTLIWPFLFSHLIFTQKEWINVFTH